MGRYVETYEEDSQAILGVGFALLGLGFTGLRCRG